MHTHSIVISMYLSGDYMCFMFMYIVCINNTSAFLSYCDRVYFRFSHRVRVSHQNKINKTSFNRQKLSKTFQTKLNVNILCNLTTDVLIDNAFNCLKDIDAQLNAAYRHWGWWICLCRRRVPLGSQFSFPR